MKNGIIIFFEKQNKNGINPFLFCYSEFIKSSSFNLFISDDQFQDEELQKTFDQISSIFEKIALGSAYFFTSSQSNLQKIGNKNIVATVTTKPINAYLIVFIAGLIFSSFHHERTRSTHPRNIKSTEKTEAKSTNIEIAKRRNSPKSKTLQNTDDDSLAYVTSIIII